jgi:uncharacterized protein (DUF58 family)
MNHFTYRCLRLFYTAKKWLFQQFTPTGLGVLACLVISGLFGLGSTQSMSHLLFFFAAALLVLAGIGSRWIHYAFKATRSLPRFGTVGEPLQYQIVIQNLTSQSQPGLKLMESFADSFPSFREFLTLKDRYLVGSRWLRQWRRYVAQQQWAIAYPRDLPVLSAESKTKVTGEILPLRRGHLSLEAITLVCPDPLGLIYKRHRYGLPQSVCILPKRYQLPPLKLSQSRRYQMGENPLVASIGESLEFRALRDYRPGDPTNKIHWRSWAKVGRPIVKEQQEDSAVHHGLILDTFLPDDRSEIFEAALTVAISFLLQEQPEASRLDVMFASQEVRCVTVGRGLRQRAQILEALATLRPCQTHCLDVLTPVVQSRLPRLSGCFCIFIKMDEIRYAFLKKLAQSGLPIKAIFLYEQAIRPVEGVDYYLTPQCRTYFVSIDNLQQDLLLL